MKLHLQNRCRPTRKKKKRRGGTKASSRSLTVLTVYTCHPGKLYPSGSKKRNHARVTTELNKYRFDTLQDYCNHINQVHSVQPIHITESVNIKLTKKEKRPQQQQQPIIIIE